MFQVDHAKRLKELEHEDAKLKRLVAELSIQAAPRLGDKELGTEATKALAEMPKS